MKLILKILVRIFLVLAVAVNYNNFRNNQCIKTQNCQPFFLSHIFVIKKNFISEGYLEYKIFNNTSNAEISFNEKINHDKTTSFNSINNNLIKIKKLNIKNISNNSIKISYKRSLEPEEASNKIKIYNCLCDSIITLDQFEEKDLYIYYNMIESFNGKISFSFEEK